MNPKDHHRRLTELFNSALGLDAKARSDFLDQACANNPQLRKDVEALLIRNDQSFDFMEQPAVDCGFADMANEAFSSHTTSIQEIDKFRVIKLLGQGAMGKVYLAQHQSTEALVAIKVLHPTLIDRHSIGRFEREAKILGRLHHEGIAQIHDAKSIDLGIGSQPIFVMEYIDGLSLTDFAEQAQLSTNERLELISRIAIAVQHAHDCDIIHRDLKPDNILVTDAGNPKILDFGIARVTNTDLQTTIQTQTGQLMGTVHYMSPEQVHGDSSKVDSRSDVYALGVLAHELLSGRLPYNLTKKTIPEAMRIILDDEPSPLGRLNATWRGDVEVVIRHALEKDPARRYQSAKEFAEDLRRILHHEPICAKPASALYRVRKFAYRNPGIAIGILASFMLLIAISSISTIAAVRIADARDEALWGAYTAHINAGNTALRNGNLTELKQHLEQAPQSERDWEWNYLANQEDMSKLSFGAHDYVTWRAQFIPNSDRVLSVGGDGLVRLWDARNGNELLTRADHGEHSTIAAVCSSDGTRVATSSIDGVVLLRNAQTLEPTAQLIGNTAPIRAMSFSPDGAMLLAGAMDGSIALFDAMTGEKISELPSHTASIWAAQYSPDGSQIATCSQDKTIHLIDSQTHEITAVLRGHDDTVHAVSFSNNGKLLASASKDHTIIIWDLENSNKLRTFTGHTDMVDDVIFLESNDQLASAGEDGEIRLWDLSHADSVAILRGHIGGVRHLDYQPANGLIASAGFDGTIKLWPIHSGNTPAYFKHNHPINTAAFSPTDSRIISTTPQGTIRVDDWRKQIALDQWAFNDNTVNQIRWNPDGQSLAVYAYDAKEKMNNVYLFDLSTGKVRLKITNSVFPAFSPDGSRLAVLRDKDIVIFDQETDEMLSTITPDNVVRSILFSPDGLQLILGCHNNDAEVWTLSTGKQTAILSGHTQPINDVVISSKTNRVFTASADRTIRIWDLRTGEPLGMYLGHDSSVDRLAINPSQSRLASASFDGSVIIWSLKTGTQLLTLSADGIPKSIEFSNDGSILHWIGSEKKPDGSHNDYWWNGTEKEE